MDAFWEYIGVLWNVSNKRCGQEIVAVWNYAIEGLVSSGATYSETSAYLLPEHKH